MTCIPHRFGPTFDRRTRFNNDKAPGGYKHDSSTEESAASQSGETSDPHREDDSPSRTPVQ